jgi:hypothetical protein
MLILKHLKTLKMLQHVSISIQIILREQSNLHLHTERHTYTPDGKHLHNWYWFRES